MDRFPPADDDPAYVSFRDVSWLQVFKIQFIQVFM